MAELVKGTEETRETEVTMEDVVMYRIHGVSMTREDFDIIGRAYLEDRAASDLELYLNDHPEVTLLTQQKAVVIEDFIEKMENFILEEWYGIMGDSVSDEVKKHRRSASV